MTPHTKYEKTSTDYAGRDEKNWQNKLQPRFTYPKPSWTSPEFFSSLSSGQMDSHCILACMNIFSVHLLLQELFSWLTPLHDLFPLSSWDIDNSHDALETKCFW